MFGFQNPQLTNMTAVGAVTSHSARIWTRCNRTGEFRIRCWDDRGVASFEKHFEVKKDNSGDNTWAIDLPGESGKGGLKPLTLYRYLVERNDGSERIGEGRFESSPDSPAETPSRFSIALMSCNQPFDSAGRIRKDAVQMLRAMRRCFAENQTKLALMVGDQMYSDYPPELSLLNSDFFRHVAPAGQRTLEECTADEVRKLYQERYRHFWNVPEWKAIQAEMPCYPIWDDHEILDNWGTVPAHQEPPWLAVGQGAKLAYYDYQASRVLPDAGSKAFHYSVVYGNTAIFVMDLRSERSAGDDGQLFSNSQETDLQRFLDEHREKPVVFIVLTVPIIQLPGMLSRFLAKITPPGEDFSDRWSAQAHLRDRNRMLGRLYRHQEQNPNQRVVLLSGDIHIGCAHELRWKNLHSGVLFQFISSGITHAIPRVTAAASGLLIRMNRGFNGGKEHLRGSFRLLPGTHGLRRNPFGGLNMGLIEIDCSISHSRPILRYSLFTHRGEDPIRVFQSHEIECGG
jgi:alkaline phosphatase D